MTTTTNFQAAIETARVELSKSSAISSVTVLFHSISGLTMAMTMNRNGDIIDMQPVE